jgi:alpha-tubulin suppressor-like RCC1 family protein
MQLTSLSSSYLTRNCLFGELGLGGFTEVWEPTQVRGELSQKRVITIAAGHSHNLCMTEDYQVHIIFPSLSLSPPVLLPGHLNFLTSQVYSFGQGDHGELGFGEQVSSEPEPRYTPDRGRAAAASIASLTMHS